MVLVLRRRKIKKRLKGTSDSGTNQRRYPYTFKCLQTELKSQLLSGNANFSTPLNNHGSSSVQQNHFTNSAGIHSCVNVEHKVTDTVQKHPTPPKGISFINLAKLSPSSSTLKQGTVTTTKGSPVQIGTCEDQSAFAKTQNKVEIPKKLPAVTPKGINFLSLAKVLSAVLKVLLAPM
ncbi:Zinc finger CCCH domain-containing protein 65 [Spatholobus suberectus]|nr:Zinc finger CCCH domain-containing protein 65 [Spatholobus suberectus]